MPWPSDVPRCGDRRLMAARMAAWSLLGACTDKPLSLNATTPMSTLGGWRSTKARRGGFGRVHARRLQIVGGHAAGDVKGQDDRALRRGRLTTACGRARAATITVRPARNSSGGRRPRSPAAPPPVAR